MRMGFPPWLNLDGRPARCKLCSFPNRLRGRPSVLLEALTAQMKTQVCMYVAMAAIVIVTGAVPIASQTPTATRQASPQSAAKPVSMDLAVHNRHNKPVLDLKPEDISVTDNGKPAKLTDLRLVNGKPQDKPLITLLFDRPGMSDSNKKKDDFLFGASGSQARGTSRKLQQIATKFLRAYRGDCSRSRTRDLWKEVYGECRGAAPGASGQDRAGS